MENTIEQRVELLESIYLQQKSVLNFIEGAKFLSLSKSYLYKLTHLGKIPHYKPTGKNIYFHRSELEQWMLQNKRQSYDEIENIAETFLTTKKGRKL
jgi:excisionase family DNA binding protein|tara:strand:- start:858 stop:1148 length:291 start_codon:yes stop_codon:yes gene_type:complete